MKRFIASVVLALIALATIQVDAQTSTKEVKKELKAEKKAERKEIRKLEGNQVSFQAKDHFFSDFGNIAGATWVRGARFDEVTFTKDGKTMTGYYDYNAELVGTTTGKVFADLPAKAQKEIKNRYKGYVTGAVIMYDDNESNDTDMLLYGAQFEDADHYFVTVEKGGKETILMVSMDGAVSFFK